MGWDERVDKTLNSRVIVAHSSESGEGDLCERLEYGFMVELATSTQKAEADVQGYYRLVVRLLYRTSWVAHFVPSAETLDVA